jgi:hypothetical protein
MILYGHNNWFASYGEREEKIKDEGCTEAVLG